MLRPRIPAPAALALFIAVLGGVPSHAQVQPHSGRVAQQIEQLRQHAVEFKPTTLCEPVAATREMNALWSNACRTAEVLRFDRMAAQRLINDRDSRIALTIPSAQGDVVLDLYSVDVVADDFNVRIASTGAAVRPSASVHYRGSIRGQVGSIASVSVFPDEMMALLSDDNGERILGRFDRAPEDLLVSYHERDLLGTPAGGCGTADRAHAEAMGEIRSGQSTTIRCVRWYWEVAHDIVLNKGGVTNAANYATALFNQSATLFANDGVSVALQELFVWNIPSPYGGNNLDARLSSFQAHTGPFNGDMGHLLDLGIFGGVAADLGSLCAVNSDHRLAYSGIQSSFNNVPTYSWSVYLVSHEAGHLLGSLHTHACVWNGNNTAIDGCASPEGQCPTGPLPTVEGGTIMSYCDNLSNVGINFNNGFGPQPGQVIRDHVNSATCLFACTDTTACEPIMITLNTSAGSGTVLHLSLAGVPLPSMTGQTLTPCLTDGCYHATTSDINGDGVNGTFVVTHGNGDLIASGTTIGATFDFSFGTVINGCTDPGADNFNPNATCDDGTCCATLTTLTLNDSGGDGWEGATYALVNVLGDTALTGTLAVGAGSTITFCPPIGCYTFSVSAGIDPQEIGWSLSGEVSESGGADTTVNVNMGNVVFGCMDPLACDYNAIATCPGSCTYGLPSTIIIAPSTTPQDVAWTLVDPNGSVVASNNGFGGVYPGCLPAVCGYRMFMADGAGNGWDQGSYAVIIGEDTVSGTLTSGSFGVDTLNFGPQAGCMDPAACNYAPLATCAATCVATPLWCADQDGDGFGDGTNVQTACSQPTGYVANGFDCDDANALVNPSVAEILNDGIDNDCDGLVDELPDADGDGFTAANGDCDDANANVNPNAPEVLNGLDDNCDGQVDEGLTDNDGDGQTANDGDCDDTDPLIFLGAEEVCDGADNDCDGTVDEGFTWYTDADGDGYGDEATGIYSCTPLVAMVNTGGDCDDTDPVRHAGIKLTLMTDDENASGSAHYVIVNAGITQEGVVQLAAETSGIGEVEFCAANGCVIIDLSEIDVPLFGSSFLQVADALPVVFPTTAGYSGFIGWNTGLDPCDGLDNDCDGQVDEDCQPRAHVRVLLEGPYNSATGVMSDGIRSLGLVPTVEPYTALGFAHLGGGGETTTPTVLAITGNDAVVDWVLLELRAVGSPSTILATRSALLQRDGDVVDTDGTSPVAFAITPSNYHIAVLHRNHLGCMTSNPVALSPTVVSVDLTSSATATYGTNARKTSGGAFPAQLLWAGDATFNGTVKYTGAGNDRDPILVTVGSTTPNNTVTLYSTRDVNLNGSVRYTGSGNDRDPILVNVGSTTPNNVRVQQLP